MELIHCPRDYLLGLERRNGELEARLEQAEQIGALKAKVEQAEASKQILERALAHVVCQGYFGTASTQQVPAPARIAPVGDLGLSGNTLAGPPVDLLSLDEDNSKSSDLGVDSTAVGIGSASNGSSAGKRKQEPDADERLPGYHIKLSLDPETSVKQHLGEHVNLAQEQCQRGKPRQIDSQPEPPRLDLQGSAQARPDFFLWGIQFTPPAALPGTKMRVVMSNIPADTTLGAVMEHIRGGVVVECVLVNTASLPLLEGTWSALIRFREAAAAEAFSKRCQMFPPSIGGRKIAVKLIQTPSYPLASYTRVSVYSYGRTRCLRVKTDNVADRQRIADSLQGAGLMTSRALETVEKYANGTMDIRFASVWYAQRAMEVIWRPTGGFCDLEHTEDPCSRPLPRPIVKPDPPPKKESKSAPKLHDPEEIYASLGMRRWVSAEASAPQTDLPN